MKEDRHLRVIERATMAAVPSESRMLYVFESGFAMDTYKPLEHELLKALVKEYGIVKTVKKENSV